jgi:hypothetical protein
VLASFESLLATVAAEEQDLYELTYPRLPQYFPAFQNAHCLQCAYKKFLVLYAHFT